MAVGSGPPSWFRVLMWCSRRGRWGHSIVYARRVGVGSFGGLLNRSTSARDFTRTGTVGCHRFRLHGFPCEAAPAARVREMRTLTAHGHAVNDRDDKGSDLSGDAARHSRSTTLLP
jgi:hypothetical protein